MTFCQYLNQFQRHLRCSPFKNVPFGFQTVNHLHKSSAKVMDDMRALYGDQLTDPTLHSSPNTEIASKEVSYFETLNIHPLASDNGSTALLKETQAQLISRLTYLFKRSVSLNAPNCYSEARKEFLLAIRDGLQPTLRSCDALLQVYLANLQFFLDQTSSDVNNENKLSPSKLQLHANRLFILALELCHFMTASRIPFGESFLILLIDLMHLGNLGPWIEKWLLSPNVLKATRKSLPDTSQTTLLDIQPSSSANDDPIQIFHRKNKSRIPAVIETEKDLPPELRQLPSPYLLLTEIRQYPRLFEAALLRSSCSLDTAFLYFCHGVVGSSKCFSKGSVRINLGMENHVRLISAFLENLTFLQTKTERGYKITHLVRLLKILLGEVPLSVGEKAHQATLNYYNWLSRSIEKDESLTQYLLPLQSHLVKSSQEFHVDRRIPDFIHLQILELWDSLNCPEIALAYGRLFCMNVSPSLSSSVCNNTSDTATPTDSPTTTNSKVDDKTEVPEKPSLLPFNPLVNAMFIKTLNKTNQFNSSMSILRYLEGCPGEVLAAVLAHNRQCFHFYQPIFDESFLHLECNQTNSINLGDLPISFVDIQTRRALLPCVSMTISGMCKIGPTYLPSAYALIQKYIFQIYPLLTKLVQQHSNIFSFKPSSIPSYSSTSSSYPTTSTDPLFQFKLLKGTSHNFRPSPNLLFSPLSLLEEQMILTFILTVREFYERHSLDMEHLVLCQDYLLWIEQNLHPIQISSLFLPKSSSRVISSKKDIPFEPSNISYYHFPSFLHPFPSFPSVTSASPFLQVKQHIYPEEFQQKVSEINTIFYRLIAPIGS